MKHSTFIGLWVLFLGMSTGMQAQNAPCTGSEYSTNADFFRASASAQSSDATASKKKAIIAARTLLSNQIKAKAEMAAQSQARFGDAERTQFMELVRGVTRQAGADLKVICEDTRQNGGKYKTDVVAEVPKADILSSLVGQAKSDDLLKGVFEEGKFKQAFR